MLVSEFVSSDAVVRLAEKTLSKMAFRTEERPTGIQIFGHDEQSMRQAAEIAASRKPDFIDLNWGCPVRKIVSKGAGSGILQNIPKMVSITRAVVQAMGEINMPVTVKTRLGWDAGSKPIVEVAERLQDIGIRAISIHGRTRAQLYGGTADWSLIGQVKNNPRMPDRQDGYRKPLDFQAGKALYGNRTGTSHAWRAGTQGRLHAAV